MRRQVVITEDHENHCVRVGMPASFKAGRVVSVSSTSISIRHRIRGAPESYLAGANALWLEVDSSNEGLRTLGNGQGLWIELRGNRSVLGSFVGFCQPMVQLHSDGISIRIRRSQISSVWMRAGIRVQAEERPDWGAKLRRLQLGTELLVVLCRPLDHYGISLPGDAVSGQLISFSDFEGEILLAVRELGELRIPYTHTSGLFVTRQTARQFGSYVGTEGYIPNGGKGYRGEIRRQGRQLVIACAPPKPIIGSYLWIALTKERVALA